MHHAFSIEESLSFGWAKTKEHSGIIFKTLLTLFALQVAYAVISRVLIGSLIGVLATIALTVAEFVVGVGLTLVTLRIAQGKHVEYKDIIPPIGILWRYFLASVLVGLIVLAIVLISIVVGLILSAIFGAASNALFPLGIVIAVIAGVISVLYISMRLMMVRFAVLDGAEVVASLRKSSEITVGHLWHLFGFLVIMVLLNILGAIVLLVGLLVTIPVTLIAYAHIYQKLLARK